MPESLFGRLPAASGPLADAFERFWKAYPRRRPNPKPPAAKVFEELVRRRVATADDLVRAAERFAREVEELGIQSPFVPHAVTWLRQRRFLDYLADDTGAESAPERNVPVEWRGLAAEIGATAFRTWVAPCRIERRGPEVLVVAPTTAVRDWVREHYDLSLRRHLRISRIVYRVEDRDHERA